MAVPHFLSDRDLYLWLFSQLGIHADRTTGRDRHNEPRSGEAADLFSLFFRCISTWAGITEGYITNYYTVYNKMISSPVPRHKTRVHTTALVRPMHQT